MIALTIQHASPNQIYSQLGSTVVKADDIGRSISVPNITGIISHFSDPTDPAPAHIYGN